MPFFICTANGKRAELFKTVFNNIVPDNIGLIDNDLKSALEQNTLKLFSFQNNKISLTEMKSLSELLHDLNSKEILGKSQIDHSIKVLKQNNPLFIKFSTKELQFYSRRQSSWQVFQKYSTSFGTSTSLRAIFDGLLLSEKSVFAENPEQRLVA